MSRALRASQAFSSTSLQHIERCLLNPQAQALRPTIVCEQTPTPWAPADLFPPKAAIMIPLMNIQGVPNILVQIRAAALRVHAGEISFPGGKHEPLDTSPLATALRETSEELGIDAQLIEPLGQIRAPEDERVLSLGNRYEVSAFAGFIHPSRQWQQPGRAADAALPSLEPTNFQLDHGEVAQILPIPLETLLDPARHSIHHFRLRPERPYYKVDVSDLVDPALVGDKLEIWGLSGWYLNLFLRSVGLMREP